MWDLAQACMAQGWDIFPVRDKRPLIKWKEGACRTWTSWPEDADVGVATGQRSGIVVVDDDRGKHGRDPWVPEVPTGVVFTKSGGRHWYYRHPGGRIANSAGKVAEYVDVRGDGGYVVSYGVPTPPLELLPEGLVPVYQGKPPSMYIAPQYRQGLIESVVNGRVFGNEGNRNNTLFRLACWFYENHMDVGVLTQGALDAGLHPDEVERTLSSVKNRVVQ